ncbi:D-alanyl-D-alanine carboxypeptidase DacB precursor [compost metagenome]
MRVGAWIVAGLIALATLPVEAKPAAVIPTDLTARAALVLDHHGKVLYARNSDVKLPPASTTKVLTVLTALEQAHLNEVVKISRNAANTPPSALGVKPGEFYTVRELLYAAMLRSANDACVALAEHIAGSEEKFAILMNRKARMLGATDSHFVNPHGLPDERHVTTVQDLALIMNAAMKNPDFVQIAGTKRIELEWKGHHEAKTVVNKNKLLTQYEIPVVGKTGFTNAAKLCYVGVVQGEQPVTFVFLGAKQLWPEARRMLQMATNLVERRTDEPAPDDERVALD